MGVVSSTIKPGAALARGYAEAALKDVTPEMFARAPTIEGKPVNASHAAFNYGHLALYPSRVLQVLGKDAAAAGVPDAWPALFEPSAQCKDDANGDIYPSMSDITTTYFRNYDAAIAAVDEADDAVFAAENPVERMRERFPTVGAMTNFLLSGHVMMHMGQVSFWRRTFGLSSVF